MYISLVCNLFLPISIYILFPVGVEHLQFNCTMTTKGYCILIDSVSQIQVSGSLSDNSPIQTSHPWISSGFSAPHTK